jgi:hypothetical protein
VNNFDSLCMDIFYRVNGHFDSLCLNSVREREKKQPEAAFLPWAGKECCYCTREKRDK